MNYEEMDSSRKLELLSLLIDNCKRLLAAKYGVNAAEPELFRVIDFVRHDGELRNEFLRRSSLTFSQEDGWGLEPAALPREMIELASHELRWPEFLQQADDRIERQFSGNASLAAGDIASAVRTAFRDDWEDREFYDRYR